MSALHIDDSRWVRIPVSVLLRRHFGMRVYEAGSGAEGLQMASALRPDLIILDVMMVDMDGFDTLVKLKEGDETKDIPVIMCTSRDLTREVNLAVRLGAVGYLTKPIEEDVLILKIQDVLKATGKWGQVQSVKRNPFSVPPDPRTDLVVPKDREAIHQTLNSTAAPQAKPAGHSGQPCPDCQVPLSYIEQYDAWYCHPCRKYPAHS